MTVTGDDAIEMAFAAAERRNGADAAVPKIGVNLRVAPYASVERDLLAVLRQVLGEAGRTHGARVVPIPIAHHGGKMDVETLRELFAGTADEDGGASLTTPQLVIGRVGE